MQKLMALMLVLALLVPAALAETTHEGAGYDSPEDAVLAYIEALNRGDVDDMLGFLIIK